MYETDPANLQPRIRKINRDVATFIRKFRPLDMKEQTISNALDIVESPWPRREEAFLRAQFDNESDNQQERSKKLIKWIRETGLESAGSIQPLPPAEEEDIKLICWMALSPE